MKWIVFISVFVLVSCGNSDDSDQIPPQVVEPVTSPPDSPIDDSPSDADNPDADTPDADTPDTDTPDADAPTINRDNHDVVLLEVFKVFTGEAFSHHFDEIPTDIAQFGEIISQGSIDESDFSNSTPAIYSCENGGTVELLIFESDFIESSSDYNFTNCQVGAMLMQGDYTTFVGGEEEFSTTDGRSSKDGLSVTFNSNLKMDFKGRYDDGCCTTRFDSISLSFSEDFSLSVEDAGEVLEISEANANYTNGELGFLPVRVANMTGGFKTLSPGARGSMLTAIVLSDFDYRSNDSTEEELQQLVSSWTFTTGILSVLAEDGSEVVLDADSGDAATVTITIRTPEGEESFDQPWSLWTNTITGQELLKLRGFFASR